MHWRLKRFAPRTNGVYAEGHRGLCLGFDVPRHLTSIVEYIEKPLSGFVNNQEWALKMILRKYSHWSYESEIRMWSTLENKVGPLSFLAFGEDLRLAEVIVGAGSLVTRKRVERAWGKQGAGIRILKARKAHNAFKMVEDENGLG